MLNKNIIFSADNYTFYETLNEDLAQEVKKQSDSIETLINMEPDNKCKLSVETVERKKHLN